MSDQIDQARVRHVAHLARLELNEREVQRFSRELSAILGHMSQLNALDTSDVEPTLLVLPLRNVLGDDQPGPSLDPQAVLSNAPQHERTFFKVPKVLDQDSA